MSNFSVNLQGKNALVTGAGEGIGWAVAEALGKAGANVFTNDLNPDRAEKIADHINAEGGHASAWQADVANKLLVGPMIEAMRDTYEHIDIVVNAAGVEKISSLIKLDEWDWRRVLDVNLNGTFFVSQMAGRVMADEGGGVIINLANLLGENRARPNSAAYAASKAAVIAFTREAAREFNAHKIRVNAVCYGNLAEKAAEVANVVLFLCSDAAAFITGQVIHVDGGESLM